MTANKTKIHRSVDRRNKMAEFFKDDVRRFINDDINCHLMCRVNRYDKGDHSADCQPLPLQEDGDKRAMLIDVKVPASIWQLDKFMPIISDQLKGAKQAGFDWQPLKVGSVVWVGFHDRDMGNWTGKGNYKLESNRMHSIQDACIESVVTP